MSKALDMARELVKQLEEAKKANKANNVQLSELDSGDAFKVGEHDFIVLEQDIRNHTTKVISKNFMAKNIIFDSNTRDYNQSNLKNVIENNIQPIIEAELGADNIVEHTVDLITVDIQHEFELCTCKVRPITFDEARKYNDLLVDKELDDWWWTCTPWSTADRGWKYAMSIVSPSGYFFNDYCNCAFGVRPVCILKSNIFVSKGD